MTSARPDVYGFYHEPTFSVCYIVADPATKQAAIIDPVLDYDEKAGRVTTEFADRLLAEIDKHGLTVACAAKNRAVSIYQTDLAIPLFVVIGGEKRGITRSFADRADLRLEIPYGRRFPRSLGTASAVAVLAFEVMRQRMQAGTREER